MKTVQVAGYAPRVVEMARQVADMRDCLGCGDCRGLCAALIEVLALPDAVLHRGAQ